MQFGKNIKKIRSIKKLSQSAFAELFGVARSSIGAYEEGRAEPRLEIIIKIAKHFGISVDNLIKHEITVNELSNFHLIDEYLGEKTETLSKKIEINSIPFISASSIKNATIDDAISSSNDKISLPGLSANNIGIQIKESLFTNLPKQFKTNDIIIVKQQWDKKTMALGSKYYLVKAHDRLHITEADMLNHDMFLFYVSNSMPISVKQSDVQILMPIEKHVSDGLPMSENQTDRINRLEHMIKELYNKLE